MRKWLFRGIGSQRQRPEQLRHSASRGIDHSPPRLHLPFWLRLLSVMALSVSLFWGSAAMGVTLPEVESVVSAPANSSPANQSDAPIDPESPLGEALLTVGLDTVETAPVYLDGRTVFSVAAVDGISASARAKVISQRLKAIAERIEKEQPQVNWETESNSQSPIVSVNGDPLMTVTDVDARIADFSQPRLLADELEPTIERALQRYQQERQPEYVRQQGRRAVIGFALLAIASFGLSRLRASLARRYRKIQGVDIVVEEKGRAVTQKDLRQRILHKQSRNLIALRLWFCFIGQWLLWGIGCLLLLGLFPYSRQWRPGLLNLLGVPLKIGAIFLVLYSLIRFGHVLVDRLFFLVQGGVSTRKRSQRLALRFSTISRVSKNGIATLLIAIGALASLYLLGLNLAPLLAGAGIIGLAISFASQNVIRDMINGFLILLEDQFGVGDVIVVGGVAGFVENMNLRITQLRNEEGRLITIPNGQIAVIENLSKEWSRVDLMISVSLNADINEALALIESVASDMHQSDEWSEIILESPLLLGVDHLDHVGATVRLWITTLPLKQWDVAREYRRRLKIAFDQANIDIGIPQQSLRVHQNRSVEKVPV